MPLSPLRFWCKKRSKRPTPKSLFFRVRRQMWCLSLVFGRHACCALDSAFCPEMQANSIPPSLSPFATARFWVEKVRKGSERGSPPRFRTCHRLCHRSVWLRFLVQKALKTANSENFVFSCQTASGMPKLKFRSFWSKAGSRRSLFLQIWVATAEKAQTGSNVHICKP